MLTHSELAKIVRRVDSKMARMTKPKKSAFVRWLETFLAEKGTDLETVFEIPGASGPNMIPAAVVVEHIKQAPAHEQAAIKTMLVRIDFANAPVLPFFRHLAQAIAI